MFLYMMNGMRCFFYFQFGRVIIRLMIAVLMVNASLAYSACCDSMSDASVASYEMEMPCHQSSKLSDLTADMDECCVGVMPLISLKDYQMTPFVSVSSALVAADAHTFFSKLDPLFKPPISFLL